MSSVFETIRSRLLARRHTALLGAIVLVFAVRPLTGDGGAAPVVLSLAFLMLMLIALLTIQIDDLVGERDALVIQRRRRRFIGWSLAALAVVERLWVIVSPSHQLLLISSISWSLFFGYATWSQLRSVLEQREVTGETIACAISVYLLLGLTWGLSYVVLFELQPDAFSFGSSPPPAPHHIFPIMIYFSMTTLSTIGFGDITPLSLQARYLAVAEGITGQFYLAILVARLVGLQMAGASGNRAR